MAIPRRAGEVDTGKGGTRLCIEQLHARVGRRFLAQVEQEEITRAKREAAVFGRR